MSSIETLSAMVQIAPMAVKKTPKIFKSHCNKCGCSTNQRILFQTDRSGQWHLNAEGYEGEVYGWYKEYRVVSCLGCDTISFRVDESDELSDDTALFYPAAAFRPKPKWMESDEFTKVCPRQIRDLYDEASITLQNECYSSAAMCARAILELTMINKVGDHGTFRKNLDAFQAAGFLVPAQRDGIEAALETGSATIHRGYTPDAGELDALLSQIEAMLMLAFLQKSHITTLTLRVPKKKKGPPPPPPPKVKVVSTG